MSVSPELVTTTTAQENQTDNASEVGPRRSALGGMGYAQGAAAVGVHDHDGCPAHDHEEPGDTVPADVATSRVEGALIDADIRARLMTELGRSVTAAQVLASIEANGGAFDIKWSARGNYQRSGAIFLDRNNTVAKWLPSMMHELNHLDDHRQGRMPNVRTAEREAFVNQKMFNEIRAHALGYVSLIQYRRQGEALPTTPPAGFDDFVVVLDAAETADGSCFSEAKIVELATPWLEDKYRNDWRGSRSGQNYYEKWEAYWDEIHADD